MKNPNKEYLYVWACDFSKSRGEGLLARNFINNCLNFTKKNILINGKSYSILKNKDSNINTNLTHNYLYPFFGIYKIWKEHLANKRTIYLNYLPLWNFLIFFLLPKNTILGPITGGSDYSSSNLINTFIRKFVFPIFFSISLIIIRKKYNKVLFSTDLLKKYIKNKKNFTFNYCLNIYDKKLFRYKKNYDLIFYYRINKNKNNFAQKKLIKKLLLHGYKIIIIGDNPFLKNSNYLGNLNRRKVLSYIAKSKFSINNNENLHSLFCLDSLSCGTKVIHFGKKNTQNFFNKNSIFQKEIKNVDKQFFFIKKILKSKKPNIDKIKTNNNFYKSKKKIKDFFLKLNL